MLHRKLHAPVGAAECLHAISPDGRAVRVDMLTTSYGLVIAGEEVETTDFARTQPGASHLDPVTQLLSPGSFRKCLTEFLARPETGAAPAFVMLIGLYRFKAIADTLGHAVGVQLLRMVADRLGSAVNQEDIVAYLGNQEFAVLGVGSAGDTVACAERLVDLIGRTYLIAGHLLNIGATIGIAPVGEPASSCDEVLRRANLALRHAQTTGGGHGFFLSTMDAEAQARRSLEIDLRRALALREFALVYQPQYNVAAQRITGFEALLRWSHPARGFVSPAEFIPLAEELGLIIPIGAWVLKTACREAARWREPLKVAVNVSAVQFSSPDLTTIILAALAESGLEPGRLELEVTESTLLTEPEAALKLLHKVRGLGVQVAIDDFGTGYSSLAYLRSFPFDKIKIDQSFIRGEPDNITNQAIVCAVAALGQRLGIPTIAEGVETKEQLDRIATDGCTDIQGYYISKPIAADDVDGYLQENAGIA
jgi:diguanylate cyclase (GGDEF)-like protein